METRKRDRVSTTRRIVDALEQVLLEKGLDGVAVNAVAEKAGVSKVLIYRYFGGIDGLMSHYVHAGGLFPHYTPTILAQIRLLYQDEMDRLWSNQSLHLFRQFRASRAARELLKATVVEHDPLADAISKAQDEEMAEMVHQFAFAQGTDSEATSAVILGALSYLTLLAQNNRSMIGINLRSEDGWQRIEHAIEQIYHALCVQIQKPDPTQLTTEVEDEWIS